MTPTHVEKVFKRRNGKFDFKVLAANGEELFSSKQGYNNEADARRSLENYKQAVRSDTVATHG
jgi:uncharacterized protein YegP (UPF0339 family)